MTAPASMRWPDPLHDARRASAAECLIAQMRICDPRIRIVRDGHEPNEAEEQRPRCVPIEPVHEPTSLYSGPLLKVLLPGIASSTVVYSFWPGVAGDERRLPGMRSRFILLHVFAMEPEVETFALDVLCHPKADEHVDQQQDDQARDRVVDKDGGDANALIEKLTDISFQDASGSAVLLDGEHSGEQRPDDTADRMHAEA